MSTPRSNAVEDAQNAIRKARSRLETEKSQTTDAPTCTVDKCLMVLGISNLLTPLDTQAPTPLLPLMLTEDMGYAVEVVGDVFATLTFSSMLSFMLIIVLTKHLSPRALLLGDYVLRLISGIAYFIALREKSSLTMPFLYISRCLYGLSLNTFALPAIWIATRMPVEERPKRITAMQAALTMGIVLGPSWGSAMAAFMPTAWQGYATPGYFTLFECSLLLGIIYAWFDDTELLPTSKPPEAKQTPDELEKERNATKIIAVCCWGSFCATMGLMAGFETLMGLGLYHSFDWDAKEAIRAWGPFALVTFVAYATAPGVVDSVNWAKIVAVGTGVGFAWSLVFQLHLVDLTTPVPLWSMYVGILGLIPSTYTQVLNFSVLATRLPSHLQVSANALIQLVGQAGRSIGPILATLFYSWFIDTYGQLGGYNGAVLFNVIFMVLILIPLPFVFTILYGNFSDPSPKEARASGDGKDKAMM